MKRVLFLFAAIFLMAPVMNAAHVVGGDITLTWVSQNQYDIQLQFYRDNLGGGSTMPTTVQIGIYEVGTNALLQNVTLQRDTLHFVTLGDECYVVDPTVYQIQKGVFSNTTPINIPDFAAGYYIQYQTWARNTLSVNLTNPGGTGISFFAMLSDPALGQNSTPEFDIYPADAYFCINTLNEFNLGVTDPDGDSLFYSLTTPLDGVGTATGSNAGSGAYPYYNPVAWNVGGGYNLANIVGGTPAMAIDPATGDITASPTIIDYFTFAVRVEEFRNGVKMGEIRRDIQYAGFNCVGGTPPTFANAYPVNAQTVQIEYNKEYCKDLIFRDANVTDTLYLEFLSTIFDSGAYLATVPPDGAGDLHFYYNNGVAPLNVPNDSIVIPPNSTDTIGTFNTGTIANRFCWTPSCSTIGQVYPFQVNAFSLGCDGKSQDSIIFNIEVIEPPINLINPGNVGIRHGVEHCTNIVHHDPNIVDAMQIEIFSDILLLGAEIPSVPTNFSYNNTVYTGNNSSIVTNVSNGAPSAVNTATRLCWVPACEQVGGTYDIQAVISSVDCASPGLKDTINFSYTIIPPFDSAGVVSNVFSPNGDGINDFYTLGYTNEDGERVGGVSNPCNDEVKVQIFNRWGALVFENNDFPEFQWDGTNKGGGKVSPGTYFVVITGTYGGEAITLGQRSITVLE